MFVRGVLAATLTLAVPIVSAGEEPTHAQRQVRRVARPTP